MPRARYEVEQLRHRINEVEDLRDEEQQNGFAEMAENADHGERHARKVVERVTDEHLRRVSVRTEKSTLVAHLKVKRRRTGQMLDG